MVIWLGAGESKGKLSSYSVNPFVVVSLGGVS
jgi:hypothetical protein